ncbi:MAG: ATP-binding protein [Bacillota bacterium]
MPCIKLPATKDNLEEMINFILNGVQEFDLGTETCLKKIRLICEEMIVNIIEYNSKQQTIKIEIEYNIILEEEKIVIKIIDPGIPFNPLEFKEPNLSSSLEERNIGGLGIYLAKKVADEMSYKRVKGKNILTVIKVIN